MTPLMLPATTRAAHAPHEGDHHAPAGPAATVADGAPPFADRVLAWVDDPARPARRLRFSERDARRALGGSPRRTAAACAELEARGLLVRRAEAAGGRHRGWSRAGAVAVRQTLADLLHLVADAPAAPAGKPGRKSGAEREVPVTALTANQRAALRWVAGLVAEHAPGARGDAGNVTLAHLARTTVRDGRVLWALETEVADFVERRGRAAAAAAARPYEPSPGTATKAAAAARLLLHFARSVGWLPAEAAAVPVVHTWAAEWHPILLRWRARLERWNGGVGGPAIRTGLQTLALYATRRGHLSPWATPWREVLADVEAEADAGLLGAPARQAVRYVWRRIPRLARLQALPTPQSLRWAVVPHAAVERTVRSVALARRGADLDFGGWVDAQGRPLAGLVEGPYGLRRWAWYTAGDARGLAADEAMPERRYEEGYKRRPTREAVDAVTLTTRLVQLALLAGWAARADGLAPAEGDAGLRPLLDHRRWERYRAWRETQPTALTTPDTAKSKGGNRHLGGMLATLCRAAGDCVFLAEHQADTPGAAAFADQRRLLERMRRAAAPKQDTFRDCVQINDAWRADGGDWGLIKLIGLRDRLVRDAEVAAKGRPVATQLDELRAFRAREKLLVDAVAAAEAEVADLVSRRRRGDPAEAWQRLRVLQRRLATAAAVALPWRTKTWAHALRGAWLIQLGRKLPLREQALRELRLPMIEARVGTDSVTLWTPGAAITVLVPGEFTKNGDPYRQAYIGRDQVGRDVDEADAARWLLELYFAPAGALDRLRADAPATVAPDEVDYVFPADPARGNKGHGHREPRTSLGMSEESLSTAFQKLVRRHGRALGVDVDALLAMHGGDTIHSFRYLAGRYWAYAMDDLDYASDLLHHGDLVITKRNYVGEAGGAVSKAARPTQAGAGAPPPAPDGVGHLPPEVRALVERLRAENVALRQHVGSAST